MPDGQDWPWLHHEKLAREVECFETPEHAIESILDVEMLTPLVIDPCCGRGMMGEAAQRRGHHVLSSDLVDWGYGSAGMDFLRDVTGDLIREEMVFHQAQPQFGFTVFMNPPFSLASDFVVHALEIGARKVVCFQRHAWYESEKREPFWKSCPPNRIWALASRATCWRIDIPPEERTGGTTTAHSWFVWEPALMPGTITGRLMKGGGAQQNSA